MKVSIITVCYNSEQTIEDTLKSVFSQGYDDIEYIIIDGNSSDSTLRIIDKYKDKITHLVSGPDQGIYDAMNKGLQLATGDIIGILNSDDFYHCESTIQKMVSSFQKNPEMDLVFGDVLFVHADRPHVPVRHFGAKRFRPWKLRFGWIPPHPGTFMRKELVQKIGLYRTDLKISADYEYFIRIFKTADIQYKWLDQIIVKMRIGGVSTSGLKSLLHSNHEIVKACKSNNLYSNWFFVMSRVPLKCLECLKFI